MKINGPLYDAIFVKRLNRFLTLIDVDGKIFKSHLPDPGRLNELLIPGAKLKVRYVNLEFSKRKTSWTTLMVKQSKQWISIDSTLPNRFIKYLLERKNLPQFKDYKLIRPEVVVGEHRFDFLLEKTGWKIIDSEKWLPKEKMKFGFRPLLRKFTSRYYIVYCERR